LVVPLRALVVVFFAVLPCIAACGGQPADGPATVAPTLKKSTPETAAKTAAPAESRQPAHPRVIFLGDSLTAGLGLDVSDSFPALIEERLRRKGYDYDVVNAGVSGDTSAGGLRRLDWALAEGTPRILIVALGGNDGLRGLPPEQLEANLAAIIERGQREGLSVILAGMEAPPNFGDDYTARFRAVYPRLAKRYNVRLIPFLLEGVAGNPALNQSDGIHPNRRGAELVADLVWKTLEPAVVELRQSSR
jgi:acyl-CoA thioesterase-1